MSIMVLRRNPARRCRDNTSSCFTITYNRKDDFAASTSTDDQTESRKRRKRHTRERRITALTPATKITPSRHGLPANVGTFPFFDLPRESRDQVYSYLTIRRTSSGTPILDAANILRNKMKRVASRAGPPTLRSKTNRHWKVKNMRTTIHTGLNTSPEHIPSVEEVIRRSERFPI